MFGVGECGTPLSSLHVQFKMTLILWRIQGGAGDCAPAGESKEVGPEPEIEELRRDFCSSRSLEKWGGHGEIPW